MDKKIRKNKEYEIKRMNPIEEEIMELKAKK